MPTTIILVFSLLAQMGTSDVVSPIGPSSGNTTSGGFGGLDRSAANLGDSQGPFSGSTPPLSTGSESTGSSTTSTGTTSGTTTSTGTSSPSIPITGASGSGYGGGSTSPGTGIGGGTTGGMR